MSRWYSLLRVGGRPRGLLVGAMLAALAGLLVVACGSDDGDVTARRAATTAGVSGGGLAGAEPNAESGTDAGETATPEPTISSIEDLVANYGYPSGYDFAQLRIPKIAVDAPVGLSIVDGDQMGVPADPATVLWYDLGGWDGLGGVPGEGQNAVFGGHVDLSSYLPYADVTYHGQGVFSSLYLLGPGDLIFVDYNGQTLQYMVTWVEDVGTSDTGRWAEMLDSDVAVDSITLYTCGGEFDSVSRGYADRVVVRAERT